MVQRTTKGFPYVEDTDTPRTYPTVNQELVTDLEAYLEPLRSSAAFTTTGSGSGISVHTSAALVVRPALCHLSISWTHGSTTVAAGVVSFWAGTVNVPFRPLRIASGTLRQDQGGGIVNVTTDGKLTIKSLDASLIADRTVYVDLTYEVGPVTAEMLPAEPGGPESKPGPRR
jgi:hypothetical protein